MDDRELLDTIYQLWSKTTGAENTYWDYEPVTQGIVEIRSVNQDGEKKLVASLRADEDADFITAIHGCLPDLVRMAHAALDEADRADFDKDSRECRIAELESALAEAQAGLAELRADLEGLIAG